MDYTRAAIALNNIGVSQLERCCYAQGMATLRDAVQTLKGSLEKDEGVGITTENEIQVAERVRKATYRLMNPEPQQQVPIQLVTVSSDRLPAWALSKIKQGPNLQTSVCAIRIDIDTHSNDTGALSPTLETAILLHNFATSYLCLSLLVPHPTHLNPLKGAMTLLAASYNVLEANRDECASDIILMCNLLSLEAIVVGNLVAVMVELNLEDQAKALLEPYHRLKNAMLLMEDLEKCFQTGQKGAPAA